MPVKIFYSWQSDRGQNRNFIRVALDAAVRELRQELALDEPNRDLVTDQDTQGVPGSPSIADTILTKIRSTDVFIADLTFINESSDASRLTPNPNVMLEYGYALHALGDGKIIGVFNETHGSPENLPFDLAHRRWPIRFNLPIDAAAATRDEEKRKLKDALKTAVRSIVSQFDEASPTIRTATVPFVPAEPGDGVGRMRTAQDYLCLTDDRVPIWLRTGPYIFLRLFPTIAMEELGEVEAYKIAEAHLQPLSGMRGGRWSTARHTSGAVSYWVLREEPTRAWDASQIFLTREIWANDYFHVVDAERDRAKEYGFAYIPTGAFEEIVIDGFINFVNIAKNNLGLSPPAQIIAGLANVQEVRLAVDPNYFDGERFAGNILRPNVVWQATLNGWSVDPFDFLLPFFNKVYDVAGLARPKIRTVGKRQR